MIDDQSVILGSNAKTKHRFRVVTFVDDSNRPIRVVTNLWSVSAETIAALYQARWRIELFFRWIKQHLQIKKLFGTSKNAVYNQLYGGLIAYVLIKWLYLQTQSQWRTVQLSLVDFFRKLLLRQLPAEAEILLCELLYRYRSFW